MQGQKRDEGRQRGSDERQRRRPAPRHDGFVPEMRHQDVQNPGQEISVSFW